MIRYTLTVYFKTDPGPLTPEGIAVAALQPGAIAFASEAETAVGSELDWHAFLAAEHFETCETPGCAHARYEAFKFCEACLTADPLAAPIAIDDEGTLDHFNRYIAGDR